VRYLQGVGSNKWDPNFTWGREVIPPINIKEIEKQLFIKREKGCLAIKKLSKKVPLSLFNKMNFRKKNGSLVDNLEIDSYLVRMGREEDDYRYFIVYNNYLNILSYNCSNYYALSVGLLSDQIK
jgi:membrane-bound lytic murein transglycosylase B